ncbi:hypothetical protein [Actinomadura macrotermitis]|nr:hypothetical protein [Actinomadura macrotermitis]
MHQPPAATPASGSPGRLVAASLIGGAVTVALAFVLAVLSHAVSSAAGGLILVLDAARLVCAVVLGAAMAAVFLIAKAKGPAAPVAAALVALVAERAGSLTSGHLTGFSGQGIANAFRISITQYHVYTLVNWVSVLVVPVVAGGLTAVVALRRPKPAPLGRPVWAPPGQGRRP